MKTTMRFLLLAAILAVTGCTGVIPTAPSPTPEKCNSKAECKEDETCDLSDGKCKKVTDTGCENDSACASPTPYCYNRKCVTESAICEQLNCATNEICDIATKSCAEKTICETDGDCKEGKFCSHPNPASNTGECKPNLCTETRIIECNKGLPTGNDIKCEPLTGTCINPPTCDTHNECVPGYLCFKYDRAKSGKCLKTANACERCDMSTRLNCITKADQPQEYATCERKGGDASCKTSLDCIGGDICLPEKSNPSNLTCDPIDKAKCTKEGNDDIDNAYAMNDGSPNEIASVEGTICGTDTNVYKYEADASTKSKKISLQLTFDKQNYGLYPVKVGIYYETDTNNPIVEKKFDLVDLNEPVSLTEVISKKGNYYIVVSATSNLGEGTTSLHYTLTVEANSLPATKECTNPTEITLNNGEVNEITYVTTKDVFHSKSLTSKCAINSENTPDRVYRFELDTDAYIHIEAVNKSADIQNKIALSIRKDCYLKEGEICSNSTQSDGLETTKLSKGTYFLVAQALNEGEDLDDYTLKIKRTNIICEPSSVIGCSADNQSIEQCNNLGTDKITSECGGDTPHCYKDENDGFKCSESSIVPGKTCEDPLLLGTDNILHPPGDSSLVGFSGSNKGRNAIIDVSSFTTCDTVKTPFYDYNTYKRLIESGGYETVVRIDALKGDQITASLNNGLPTYSTPIIYILKGGCTSSTENRCVLFQGGNGKSSYVSEAVVTYDVTEDGVYYVIGDYQKKTPSSDEYTWNLNAKRIRPVCREMETKCANATTQQLCEIAPGSSPQFVDEHKCSTGVCEEATKRCQVPENNRCGNATDITTDIDNGTPIVGYIDEYDADFQIAKDHNCIAADASGKSAFYTFVPKKVGDVYNIKLKGPYETDLLMVLSKDCNTANLVTSCKGSIGKYGTDEASIKYIAEDLDPIYITVIGHDASSRGKYALEVNRSEKQCERGTAKCSDDKSQLIVCSGDGTKETATTCPCDDSVTPKCTSGWDGKSCASAYILTPNVTERGDFSTLTKNYNPGPNKDGECEFSTDDNPIGPDTFYAIDVPAENLLRVEYSVSSSASALVYIIDKCEEHKNSCKALSNIRSTSGNLEWLNDSNETKRVYVVVDSRLENPTGTYELTATLQPVECNMRGKALKCITNNGNKNELEICNNDYLKERVQCYFGCDDSGASPTCNKPTNNTCDTPYEFNIKTGETMTFKANLADYHKNFEHGANTNCDTNSSTSNSIGPDGVFKITATQGDDIEIVYNGINPRLGTIYEISSCGVITNDKNDEGEDTYDPTNQCVTGFSNNFTEETIYEYIPGRNRNEKGSIYFVVDSYDKKLPEKSDFTITVKNWGKPFCYPNEVTCTPASATNRLARQHTCNSNSTAYASERNCYHGCNTSNNGCAPSPNSTCDNDSSIPLIEDDTIIEDDLLDFTADYDPKTSGRCFSSDSRISSLAGNDAVYKLQRPEDGDVTLTLEPQYVTSNNLYISIYDGTACSNITNQNCAKGESTDNAPAKITYSLKANKPVYLVIDTADNNNGEAMPFKLTVDFEKSKCTDGETKCDPYTLGEEKCFDGKWVKRQCKVACSSTTNKCGEYSNSLCEGAETIDITSLTSGGTKNIKKGPNDLTHIENNYGLTDSESIKCRMTNPNGNKSESVDMAFKLKGKKGQIVRVTSPKVGNYIYAIESIDKCTPNSTCIQNNTISDLAPNKYDLVFKMPADEVYLISEVANTSSGKVIDLTIDSPKGNQYKSNDTWCDKAGRYIYQSDTFGATKGIQSVCTSGCTTATPPACIPPTNTTCGNAKEIDLATSDGDIVIANLTEYTANTDSSNDICGADNSGSQIVETNGLTTLFYKVTAAADDVISIDTDVESAKIYAVDDCSSMNNTGACGDDPSNATNHLKKVVGTSGIFYFVVTQTSSSRDSIYKIRLLKTGTKICDKVGKQSCNASRDAIVTCLGDSSESTPCTNCDDSDPDKIKCKIPGDTCADAIEVYDGFQQTGTLKDYTSQDTPKSCTSGTFDNPYPDNAKNKFFKFTLPPNHHFKATLTNPDDYEASMWLTTDCSDENACTDYVEVSSNYVINNNLTISKSNNTTAPIDYYLALNTKYYEDDYEPSILDISITEMCTEGPRTCNGDMLEECVSGEYIKKTYCNNGCFGKSNKPYCIQAQNFNCPGATAVDLTSGPNTVKGMFKNLASSTNVAKDSTCSTNTFEGSTGYYKVDLQKGETLRYSVTMPDLDNYNKGKEVRDWDYPLVFIMKGCSEPYSCSDYIEGNNAVGRFTADETTTYYVGIQERKLRFPISYPSGYYELTLEKSPTPTTCDPSKLSCGAGTPSTLTACNTTTGESISLECPANMTQCDTSSTDRQYCYDGSSVYHTGLVCADAIDIVDQQYTSGAVQGGFNTLSLASSAQFGSCTTSERLNGNEMFYTYKIQNNSRIILSYETTSENAAVYLLASDSGSCSEDTCKILSKANSSKRGTLMYENSSGVPQTLTIVFDSTVPGDMYDFNFTAISETFK